MVFSWFGILFLWIDYNELYLEKVNTNNQLQTSAVKLLNSAITGLICSIVRALIRCIKCIRDKQMHFNFIDVLILYYGHQHVSTSGDLQDD
jgi:hypothetical protein